MKNLIEGIKYKLSITGGIYTNAEIEDYIKDINPNQYFEFFKALSGSGFKYQNASDRLAIVSNKFRNTKEDTMLQGTNQAAKEMYNKFYSQNCAMTTYTQQNRNKVPNDRVFFETMDYAKLKNTDGEDTYTKQELYVLNELGGGSWLMDIRFLSNAEVAINKIKNIIKLAIKTKYSKSETTAIQSKRVLNMFKGNKQ